MPMMPESSYWESASKSPSLVPASFSSAGLSATFPLNQISASTPPISSHRTSLFLTPWWVLSQRSLWHSPFSCPLVPREHPTVVQRADRASTSTSPLRQGAIMNHFPKCPFQRVSALKSLSLLPPLSSSVHQLFIEHLLYIRNCT